VTPREEVTIPEALDELMELPALERLLRGFQGATGLPAALTDPGGRSVLEPHRPGFCERYCGPRLGTHPPCLEADPSPTPPAAGVVCRCPHGLTHAVAPLLVGDRHLASVVAGPFLLGPPDSGTVRARIEAEGVDREGRRAALAELPIVPRGRLRALFTFLTGLAELAGSMGAGRARERRQVQRERERAEQLRAIGAEIARAPDVAALLDLILERATQLIDGSGGSLLLWDEADQALVARAQLGDFADDPRTPVPLGEGVAGRVGASRRGLIAQDAPARQAAPEPTPPPLRTVIAEPLVFRDRLIVVLSVGSRDGGRRFTEQDGALLSLLADQAAIAIVHARLSQEMQREVADRRRAEGELSASRDLLETALRGMDEAVFAVDQGRRVVEWARSAEALFGYPRAEMLGVTTERLYATVGEFERVGRELDTAWREGGWKGETLMVRRDGSVFPAAIYGGIPNRPARPEDSRLLVGVVRDIGERRQAELERQRLEEQFRQAQKMETVGRLAGGIAHDLNNLLTPILGYAELALLKLALDERARPDVYEIQEAAKRARDLTHQLLAFSRKQPMELKPVNLGELVTQLEKILRRTVREDIHLVTRIASGGGVVRADPAQLQQVLLNLVVNANDAMPTGGVLTIATDEVVCSPRDVAGWPDARPGPYVRLIVQDTGCGMDVETRQHLFEPFFTTKPEGQGTGLGLATCYGIVKQHGGDIRVESIPGRGSSFTVYLPRAEDPHAPAVSASPPRPAAGRETILLIDDARTVRLLLESILGTLEYATLVAATPEEAIRVARTHPGPIQLLITDVIMPGMNGRQLYDCLREIRPDLKVLYISGYTDDIIAPHGVLEPGIHFLAKPFTVAALAEKVREALAGG